MTPDIPIPGIKYRYRYGVVSVWSSLQESVPVRKARTHAYRYQSNSKQHAVMLHSVNTNGRGNTKKYFQIFIAKLSTSWKLHCN